MPKIILKKFFCNLLEWKLLQERYEIAAEAIKKFSNREIFYLPGHLKGITFSEIEGFPLTSNNYKHVWRLLKVWYEYPELIVYKKTDE